MIQCSSYKHDVLVFVSSCLLLSVCACVCVCVFARVGVRLVVCELLCVYLCVLLLYRVVDYCIIL
jgi:hypothetical protein